MKVKLELERENIFKNWTEKPIKILKLKTEKTLKNTHVFRTASELAVKNDKKSLT